MDLDTIKSKFSTFDNDVLFDLIIVSQPYKFKLYHQVHSHLRFDYGLQNLINVGLIHAKVLGNNAKYTTLLLTLTRVGHILLDKLLLPHKSVKFARFWNYTIPNFFSIISGILSIICLFLSISGILLNMSTLALEAFLGMTCFTIIFALSFVGCFGVYNFHFSKYTKYIDKPTFNKFSDKYHLDFNSNADIYLFN